MKNFFQQMVASFFGTLAAIVVLLSLGATGLVLLGLIYVGGFPRPGHVAHAEKRVHCAL